MESISRKETIQKKLMTFFPRLQPPIFNPLLRYLQVPTNTCPPLTLEESESGIRRPPPHDVVIVYKSGVYNFENRNQLRRLFNLTNASFHIHLIFSIGLPRSSGSNVFQRDGFNVTLTDRAGQKLLENSKSIAVTNSLLNREMQEHSDLLVGNYEDSYYNLSLKLFYTFQWAARFCRPYKPIFIFIDDDYAVNLSKLSDFLLSKTPQQREELAHGFELSYNPVHRPSSPKSKWAFSKREVPWPHHPIEHLGIYSIWSYNFVHDMALAMHFVKPLILDDTWLAMVQLKLKLGFTHLPGMYFDMVRQPLTKCSDILFAPAIEILKRNCF